MDLCSGSPVAKSYHFALFCTQIDASEQRATNLQKCRKPNSFNIQNRILTSGCSLETGFACCAYCQDGSTTRYTASSCQRNSTKPPNMSQSHTAGEMETPRLGSTYGARVDPVLSPQVCSKPCGGSDGRIGPAVSGPTRFV